MNIYFDMDGVLAIYEPDAYIQPHPKFMRLNEHYYRSVKPDELMTHLFNQLCLCKHHKTYILTSVSTPLDIRSEQVIDKIQWLERYCPQIDIDNQFIVAATDKRDTISAIGISSPSDILIDDFNRNLNHWKTVGGTAVKYCNGINSPDSFSGPKIYNTMKLHEIAKILNIEGDINDSALL